MKLINKIVMDITEAIKDYEIAYGIEPKYIYLGEKQYREFFFSVYRTMVEIPDIHKMFAPQMIIKVHEEDHINIA